MLLIACPCTPQPVPIGMDRSESKQTLYVLDEDGIVWTYTKSQLDGASTVFVKVRPELKALNVRITKIWDRETVFVTGYGITTSDPRPRILQYSSTGQKLCEWILPEISTGVDVDTEKRVVYLSGASTGTLYSLKLLSDTCYGPNQLNIAMIIKGASRLGPLVVDSARRVGFVSDVLRGSLYQFLIDHGYGKEVLQGLGQPVALAFSHLKEGVFVADSGGRRIWRVSLQSQIPSKFLYFSDSVLDDPSSLVLSSDGRLIVGDRGTNSLLVVKFPGKLDGRVVVASP